jgi:hypothetical protein
MSRRERIGGLLLLLAVVVAVRLGTYLFHWYAYAEERGELQALSTRLEEAGVVVVQTQQRSDHLRDEIERIDRELKADERAISAYDRHARDGALPGHLYGSYRADLEAYNRVVGQRNARFERWKEVVVRNHASVNRFNALADSMRAIAAEIGEPYYPIPSPVEVAVERGILPE